MFIAKYTIWNQVSADGKAKEEEIMKIFKDTTTIADIKKWWNSKYLEKDIPRKMKNILLVESD